MWGPTCSFSVFFLKYFWEVCVCVYVCVRIYLYLLLPGEITHNYTTGLPFWWFQLSEDSFLNKLSYCLGLDVPSYFLHSEKLCQPVWNTLGRFTQVQTYYRILLLSSSCFLSPQLFSFQMRMLTFSLCTDSFIEHTFQMTFQLFNFHGTTRVFSLSYYQKWKIVMGGI